MFVLTNRARIALSHEVDGVRLSEGIPVLLIQLRLLDSFVFGTPVLEPDLDLRLGEPQGSRELESASPRDVLPPPVLDLQSQSLLAAERRPLPPRSTLFPPPARHCNEEQQISLRFYGKANFRKFRSIPQNVLNSRP